MEDGEETEGMKCWMRKEETKLDTKESGCHRRAECWLVTGTLRILIEVLLVAISMA